MTQTRHAGQPGQTIETMMLHDGNAENAVINLAGINGASFKFATADPGGKFNAVQVLHRTLPFRKWRRPVASVGNFCVLVIHDCYYQVIGRSDERRHRGEGFAVEHFVVDAVLGQRPQLLNH
jgi:hypothetical protein